jgi:hypothetical protein
MSEITLEKMNTFYECSILLNPKKPINPLQLEGSPFTSARRILQSFPELNPRNVISNLPALAGAFPALEGRRLGIGFRVESWMFLHAAPSIRLFSRLFCEALLESGRI